MLRFPNLLGKVFHRKTTTIRNIRPARKSSTRLSLEVLERRDLLSGGPFATATSLSSTLDTSGTGLTFHASVSSTSTGCFTYTGTMTFTDGTTTATEPVDWTGNATWDWTTLPTGGHAVTATYSGSSDLLSSVSPVDNVSTTTTTLSSDSSSGAVYGQTVTFSASVSADGSGAGTPVGSVDFYDNTTATDLGAVTLDGSGNAILSTANLPQGNNSISANYLGSSQFTISSSALSQAVQGSTSTALTSSLDPSGTGLTFTANVTSTASGMPTGTVTFTDGATTDTETVDGSGNATWDWTTLPTGGHAVTATYSGDSYFLDSVSPVNNVSTTTTTLSSDSSSGAVYGQTVNFTATVSADGSGAGTPVGSVDFYDNTTATDLGAVTLDSNGNAVLSTTNLPQGSNSISANYLGASQFTVSSASLSQVVQGTTSTALTSSLDSSGTGLTFTASVTSTAPGTPTGTVTFTDGTTTDTETVDGSGNATWDWTTLPTGSHAVTATYSGDSNFQSSVSPVDNVSTTTTTLSTDSSGGAIYGQAVTFTASVSADGSGAGTPVGSVDFYDNTTATDLGAVTLDSNGNAMLSTTNVPQGNNSISANYLGASQFTVSSASLSQVVQGTTSTALTSSLDSSGIGLTFTANVTSTAPGTPTGMVTFTDGVTTTTVSVDSSSNATWDWTPLPTGGHQVTANYSGDSNFQSSVSAVDYVSTTTTSLSSDGGSVATYGQTVDLTASVSADDSGAGVPPGSVDFYDNTTSTDLGSVTLDGNGNAVLSTTNFALGNNSISANYLGAGQFTVSSASLSQIVKDPTTTTLSSSANPSVYGQSVTFTATVSANDSGLGTPTGTLTFLDGGVPLDTETLINGTASYTTSTLTVGTHNITTEYGGDNQFDDDNSQVFAQVVNPNIAYWIFQGPGAGDFTTAANWNTNAVPTAQTTIIFDGGKGNGNCALDGNQEVAAVITQNAFSGVVNADGQQLTVDHGGSWATGSFGRGSLVLASDTFDWTGGILNSTATLGNINVQNTATFAIDGDNMTLGDNLNVAQGGFAFFTTAVKTVVTLTNSAEITNNGLVQLEAASIVSNSASPSLITNYGTIQKLDSTYMTLLGNIAIENVGPYALLEVGSGTTLLVGGEYQFAAGIAGSVYQIDGVTQLDAGSTLNAMTGFWMANGSLTVPGDTSGEGLASTANLDTFFGLTQYNANIMGGWIKLGSDAPNGVHRSTLTFNDGVVMRNTTIRFGLDVSTLANDGIRVNGNINVDTTDSFWLDTTNLAGITVPKRKWNNVLTIPRANTIIGNFGKPTLPKGYWMGFNKITSSEFLQTYQRDTF